MVSPPPIIVIGVQIDIIYFCYLIINPPYNTDLLLSSKYFVEIRINVIHIVIESKSYEPTKGILN